MLIKNIFPINIFIQDSVLNESELKDLTSTVEAIFSKYKVENGTDYTSTVNNEIPFFTSENISSFPILGKLREKFIDGFYKLSNSFESNTLTKQMIEQMVCKNSGKLPLMKKGDYKRTHNHYGASAFAVFYLSDVNNDKHGGKLILKDPSFHSNLNFHPPEEYEIETKKNRLIISPGYVWHEVSPYLGEEDRLTIVINLDF